MTGIDGNVLKTCGYCEGRGNVPDDSFLNGEVTCPVCNGSTQVSTAASAMPHADCDGDGKIKIRGPMGKQIIPCSGCQGTGWA